MAPTGPAGGPYPAAKLRVAMKFFLDPAMVQQIWRDHTAGRTEGQNQLWPVLMFQAWIQAFEAQ